MNDTLTPVEHTNWALSAWNSTLDRNDVSLAWLYGQDHLWATSHLVVVIILQYYPTLPKLSVYKKAERSNPAC